MDYEKFSLLTTKQKEEFKFHENHSDHVVLVCMFLILVGLMSFLSGQMIGALVAFAFTALVYSTAIRTYERANSIGS